MCLLVDALGGEVAEEDEEDGNDWEEGQCRCRELDISPERECKSSDDLKDGTKTMVDNLCRTFATNKTRMDAGRPQNTR